MSVVGAADASVLILFMENPHALQMNHPDEYTPLHDSWKKMQLQEPASDAYSVNDEANEEEGPPPDSVF